MIFCAKLWPKPADRMNDSLGPHTGPYAHQHALNVQALPGATGRCRSAMSQREHSSVYMFITVLNDRKTQYCNATTCLQPANVILTEQG